MLDFDQDKLFLSHPVNGVMVPSCEDLEIFSLYLGYLITALTNVKLYDKKKKKLGRHHDLQ